MTLGEFRKQTENVPDDFKLSLSLFLGMFATLGERMTEPVGCVEISEFHKEVTISEH